MRRSTPVGRATDMDAVAEVTARLAVLLAAGVSPPSAWRHLSNDRAPDVVRHVVQSLDRGGAVEAALAAAVRSQPPSARSAWECLGAAWAVSAASGAPLAETLHRLSQTFADLAEVGRDCEVALAGPRSSARVVMVLPAVGWLFSLALGVDALRVTFTTIPGLLSFVLGAGLMVVAAVWMRRLVAAAARVDARPGLREELVAVALSGGLSTERAERMVDTALRGSALADLENTSLPPGIGSSPADAERTAAPERGQLAELLDLSRRAGVPAAALLSGSAAQLRRAERTRARIAAARLGSLLILPLGLCLLPAFVLIGVVPLVLSVLFSTVGTVS